MPHFTGKAPAAARPDMWQDLIESETTDGFGFRLRGRVNEMGYQSVAVPGSLKAYFEAVTRYGTMDWRDIVKPAIDHAERSWTIRPHVYKYIAMQEFGFGRVDNLTKIRTFAASRALLLCADGMPHGPGTKIVNRNYAQTLRTIASDGAEAFYTGSIAQEIAAEMSCHGGLITLEDLKDVAQLASRRSVAPIAAANCRTTRHRVPAWCYWKCSTSWNISTCGR